MARGSVRSAEKFIVADYLAKVQIQTHFFLCRAIESVVVVVLLARTPYKMQGKETTRTAEQEEEEGKERAVQVLRFPSSSFSLSLPISSSLPLFPSVSITFSLSLALSLDVSLSLSRGRCHSLREVSAFESRGSRGFSRKTCIAFYCRIDHLNNGQHGKPRSQTRTSSLQSFVHLLFAPLFLSLSPSLLENVVAL